MRPIRYCALILTILAAAGCAEEVPAPLNRADFGAVARAWVHAWCRGDGSQTAFEFDPAPEGHPATLIHLPQGIAAKSLGPIDFGIGECGVSGPDFQLTSYALRPGDSRSVSSKDVNCIVAVFDVELANGESGQVQIALRPNYSHAVSLHVTPTTQWSVVPPKR